MSDFFDRLEETRSRWNVLEHPFYQRWTNGELTKAELAVYSGQYRHAVVAIADASAQAASAADGKLAAGLAEHAREEADHVRLWDRFVDEVGGDAAVSATPETEACVSEWAGSADRPLLDTLVTLYSIESGQPAISETKREGLVARYGYTPEGPATEYFDLHAVLDVEHAEQARKAIEPRLEGADEDALLEVAEAALRSNWELLDGVEKLLGR
ncbi:MAG: iron-containing redox enzyme family protein [Actinomycetes bacterium]